MLLFIEHSPSNFNTLYLKQKLSSNKKQRKSASVQDFLDFFKVSNYLLSSYIEEFREGAKTFYVSLTYHNFVQKCGKTSSARSATLGDTS